MPRVGAKHVSFTRWKSDNVCLVLCIVVGGWRIDGRFSFNIFKESNQQYNSKMLWYYVLAAIIGLIVWMVVNKTEDDPVYNLPGPKRWPVIGSILPFIGASKDDLFPLLQELHKKYGHRFLIKVFRRNIIHVLNVSDIEIILSHSKNLKKNKPYSFLESWLGTGLLLSTGSKWRKRRKILTPTFHFNILKNFAKVFERNSRNFVIRLKHMPEEVDVISVISDYTLDAICETAMGTQLNTDKSAATVEYKEAIKKIGNTVLYRLTRFWLHNNVIFYNSAIGKQFVKQLNIVQSFADNVIKDRMENELKGANKYDAILTQNDDEDDEGVKKKLAFLDLLIDANSKGEIDLDGIRDEVNTFMFEGHDTTAMALAFGLMLLADHGKVQEHIYEECKSIFGDSDRAPSITDLAEMKYLEATIKEILRLYPSVPFVGREITEDFMLDDLPVKKGMEVVVHIYSLHRRSDLYPDPEEFQPERFLTGETRHPYAFIPFSAGPRNCIGQRFAMQEMKYVLSEICRHFTLESKTPGVRPLLQADIVLRPIKPIYVKFIPR